MFSDKIGTVRPSRMIFGDAAAALVVEPAPDGCGPEVEMLQTYASGPVCEVESIIWPNPDFDNDVTVYGPARSPRTGRRYLKQMIEEFAHFPKAVFQYRPGLGYVRRERSVGTVRCIA